MPGGSSTEKESFTPASPAFFSFFPQGWGGDTALGNQLLKVSGRKTDIFQTFQPPLPSQV
jgi:hypothetical protein